MTGPEEYPRVPDGYDRLWTPHRMAYIDGENKPPDDGAGARCPFCRAPGEPDEQALIVYRGETCYAVLNLYPYNPGHLLICSYRHVPDLTTMTAVERGEMTELTTAAMATLSEVKNCDGFNLGMNAGPVAGAGVAGHVHQHVVPRWAGDANFLPIVGRTKALPELLGDTREQLATGWVDGPR